MMVTIGVVWQYAGIRRSRSAQTMDKGVRNNAGFRQHTIF